MKLTIKDYKTLKIKEHLKKEDLLLFYNGVNKNSFDLLLTKQKLRTICLNYHKIFNQTTIEVLENSVYKNIKPTIEGATFLVKPATNCMLLTKSILLNSFESSLFNMLTIKLNNKIYSLKQLKGSNSLNYTENMLLIFQFRVSNLKKIFMLSR
jgi:hypothetical protein